MRHLTTLSLTSALLFAASTVQAQVSSSLQSISLTASKGESVTLGAPTPTTQSLTIVDNALNPYPQPFSVTVGWDVRNSTSTVVSLVAYFLLPNQALVNGTDNITAALVEVSTDVGATWKPMTSTAVAGVGVSGGSVVLFASPVTQGEAKRGTKVVSFMVRLNLVGAPATSAGTYTGTMNMMAISK
jgi:hypothetical protein